LQLGLAQLVVPAARVVMMRRDPLDLCISCFFQDFGGTSAFAYDLDDLAHVIARSAALSEHWRRSLELDMRDVDFAALVRDPDATARALAADLGLPPAPAWPRDTDRKDGDGGVGLAGLGGGFRLELIGRGQVYAAHLGAVAERLAQAGTG
jgi:hypothetical protein